MTQIAATAPGMVALEKRGMHMVYDIIIVMCSDCTNSNAPRS